MNEKEIEQKAIRMTKDLVNSAERYMYNMIISRKFNKDNDDTIVNLLKTPSNEMRKTCINARQMFVLMNMDVDDPKALDLIKEENKLPFTYEVDHCPRCKSDSVHSVCTSCYADI